MKPGPKPQIPENGGTYEDDTFPLMTKDCPMPPDYLNDEASGHWRFLAPTLYREGLLSYLDVDSFAQYCAEWATWKEAQADVDNEGITIWRDSSRGYKTLGVNPARHVVSDCLTKLKDLRAKFGLTPLDRRSIRPNNHDESGKKGDPLQQLQGNKKQA